ncbi:hypothetical protein C8R42DRAFT_71556 [Lentinula raphanica]|nr:hypothetical protein C8R42DRAFT_71556 [Lentinula raphanica]
MSASTWRRLRPNSKFVLLFTWYYYQVVSSSFVYNYPFNLRSELTVSPNFKPRAWKTTVQSLRSFHLILIYQIYQQLIIPNSRTFNPKSGMTSMSIPTIDCRQSPEVPTEPQRLREPVSVAY